MSNDIAVMFNFFGKCAGWGLSTPDFDLNEDMEWGQVCHVMTVIFTADKMGG